MTEETKTIHQEFKLDNAINVWGFLGMLIMWPSVAVICIATILASLAFFVFLVVTSPVTVPLVLLVIWLCSR